ncbi:MAG: RmlD substrate binding domain [Gammaproteobacteria bacterium]|jgi:hypothetical protein|nr:RmlD substrate binding domain [Gammaproteobacteria bacterium]
MWGIKKTLLVTGANGLVGRILYHALKPSYQLILVDNKVGQDPYNRFGLEKAEIDTSLPEGAIHKLDLSLEKERFEEVLRSYKPDCVIHLAGLLENQEPELIKSTNQLIHSNTLEACAKLNIPVIAMSSIMVMYGAAIKNDKIRQILAGMTNQGVPENERLSVNTPLDNSEDNIKAFNPDSFENNLAYIQSKEGLESLAQRLARLNPSSTMIMVRLGWLSIKNPYELEGDVKHSEITACLAKEDMISAMQSIIDAVLSHKIEGYRSYPLISEHPQRWASLAGLERDLGWKPSILITERFGKKAGEAAAAPC